MSNRIRPTSPPPTGPVQRQRFDPVKAAAEAAGQAITLAREAAELAKAAQRWATVLFLVGVVELAMIVALVVTE